jgi:hypothetical protein
MSHDTVYDPKKPNMVYLRPNPGARPIKYEQAISLQGLMLDRKHSIAMYTSRAGMAVGPAGPIPDVYDTIIASCSDEFTPLTIGGPKTTFRAPYPFDMTTGYVRASLTTEPSGSGLEIDITMNGTSIFSGTNYLTIDAGSRTSVGSASPPVYNFPGNAVPDDAEFLVHIISVGSGYAGAGLKVALTGKKVEV